MPLDATMPAGDEPPRRGTVESFRLLTARLKRSAAPELKTLTETPPAEPPTAQSTAAAVETAPPTPLAVPAAPPEPGEAASALLDIIWGAADLPPQERSMVGDTLLLLLHRLTPKELAVLAERVAAMDQPPPLLVSQLLRDPRPEVGGVVLERSAALDAGELLAACRGADPERARLIARRRTVPALVADHLIQSGDLLSQLALLRNPGAEISFPSFMAMSQLAGEHPALQVPMVLRTDLPLAVALELFWRLPPELRRVIFARFLSDSVTLGRILSLALAAGSSRTAIDNAPPQPDVDAALEPLFANRREEAALRLSRLAGIAEETAARILADGQGEALAVLLKALGLGRSRFDDALDRARAATGIIRDERPLDELKAVFDGLSFTKARVLLVYWDWFTRREGPYAPAA